MMCHIVNKHSWHDGLTHNKCPLGLPTKTRNQNLINEGTPAYFELECVAKDKTLLPDMKHLTKFCHTGQLEVCYLVVNRFYSKRLHFSGNGVVARNKLPILDHNSGMDFDYAKTKAGQETFKLVFSKATKKLDSKKNYIVKIKDVFIRTHARSLW